VATEIRSIQVPLDILLFPFDGQDLLAISRQNTTFTCHDSRTIRRRPNHPVCAFSEVTAAVVTALPSDVSPVDYQTEPNKLVIPIHVPTILPPAQPPLYTSTWQEYVANLPTWEQALLPSVTFVDKQRLFGQPKKSIIHHRSSTCDSEPCDMMLDPAIE
jgi:hypothetical protein